MHRDKSETNDERGQVVNALNLAKVGEDDWRCQKNGVICHGRDAGLLPETACWAQADRMLQMIGEEDRTVDILRNVVMDNPQKESSHTVSSTDLTFKGVLEAIKEATSATRTIQTSQVES